MSYFRRQTLDHLTPSWVEGRRLYFITICCTPRHRNQLCHAGVAGGIFNAVAHYYLKERWYVEIMLLMPDHLHALVGFPASESMSTVIRTWKHYLTSKYRINWQRDYFDHRLRSHEGHQEKTDYILNNPVRAGLAKSVEEWPYVWRTQTGR